MQVQDVALFFVSPCWSCIFAGVGDFDAGAAQCTEAHIYLAVAILPIHIVHPGFRVAVHPPLDDSVTER